MATKKTKDNPQPQFTDEFNKDLSQRGTYPKFDTTEIEHAKKQFITAAKYLAENMPRLNHAPTPFNTPTMTSDDAVTITISGGIISVNAVLSIGTPMNYPVSEDSNRCTLCGSHDMRPPRIGTKLKSSDARKIIAYFIATMIVYQHPKELWNNHTPYLKEIVALMMDIDEPFTTKQAIISFVDSLISQCSDCADESLYTFVYNCTMNKRIELARHANLDNTTYKVYPDGHVEEI